LKLLILLLRSRLSLKISFPARGASRLHAGAHALAARRVYVPFGEPALKTRCLVFKASSPRAPPGARVCRTSGTRA
jgi:hypothetical protein